MVKQKYTQNTQITQVFKKFQPLPSRPKLLPRKKFLLRDTPWFQQVQPSQKLNNFISGPGHANERYSTFAERVVQPVNLQARNDQKVFNLVYSNVGYLWSTQPVCRRFLSAIWSLQLSPEHHFSDVVNRSCHPTSEEIHRIALCPSTTQPMVSKIACLRAADRWIYVGINPLCRPDRKQCSGVYQISLDHLCSYGTSPMHRGDQPSQFP